MAFGHGNLGFRRKGLQEFTSSTTWVAPFSGFIDVFCVGGGGNNITKSGSSGGYTKTTKRFEVIKGQSYSVVVGANGGGYSQFGNSVTRANGGLNGDGWHGKDGGSGGGAGCGYYGCLGRPGGSDGGDGYDGQEDQGGAYVYLGGSGQGTTTRYFGESTGARFSAGGGGQGFWKGSVGLHDRDYGNGAPGEGSYRCQDYGDDCLPQYGDPGLVAIRWGY